MLRLITMVASATMVPLGPAFAHTGVHGGTGFLAGLTHPIGSLDHALAAMAVGLLATALPRRAVVLLPLSFLASMSAGVFLAMAGASLPFVELAIAASVVGLGLAILFRGAIPPLAALALVGGSAVFHGYAHGSEMHVPTSLLPYGAGLLVATAMLHLGGMAVGAALPSGWRGACPGRARSGA